MTKLGRKEGKEKWAAKRDILWRMKQETGLAMLLKVAKLSSKKKTAWGGKGGGKVEGGVNEWQKFRGKHIKEIN